ncbi:Inulin fructotransferase [DFA-I-forming] [Fructobacillus sp. EFB-N1]|nr:Inulin fructotransferase [DFA-I-forming] [Fructobacillus sp. EFB-N1]
MADIDYGYLKDDDGQRFYPITNYELLTNKPDLSGYAKSSDLSNYASKLLFNIDNYGAKSGDRNFDNAPIINNLINKLPSNGGTIYIPVGDYWVNTPIIINNNYVHIVGENSGFRSNIDHDPTNSNRPGGGSKLCLTPTNPIGLKLGDSNIGDRLSGVVFDNLNIVGAAAIGKQVSQTGIYLNRNSDGVKIINNVIMNLDFGVVAVGSDALHLSNNWICELTNGVHVIGSSQQCQIQNNYIGCQPRGISLKFDNPYGATVTGNNIYPDGFECIEINNGTICNISGNNFQSFYTGAIKMSGNNILFSNNMIYLRKNNGNWSSDPIGRDGKYGAIHIDGDDYTINGNHILSEQPSDDTRILIMSGSGNKLSMNTISGVSNRKIVINGSCNNTLSIYNCSDSEFDGGGNSSNRNIN